MATMIIFFIHELVLLDKINLLAQFGQVFSDSKRIITEFLS